MTLLLTDRKILLLTTPKKFTISLFKTFLDLVMLAVSFKIYNFSKDILLNVKNCFTYYQRCKNKNCSFHASFYLFLDYYVDSSNCVLREMQKRLYSNVKYSRLLIVNLQQWKLCYLFKRKTNFSSCTKKKRYTRKNWSGRKEKGPVDRFENLILNRYILVNMVF